MKELTKHIEALLVDNDCVILPHFGGFVTNHAPARWIEEENIFLPPYRTIGFNPQLKINDGLLVQSYMLTHDATYPEATRLAEAAIGRLSEELYKEGFVDLHGIGTLRRTIVGDYQFDATEDGVITPALYGMGALEMKPLALLDEERKLMVEESVVSMNTQTEETPVIENKNRTITIKIRHEWITNAVAVAAAVMLFFFLSTPVDNTYIEEENYASLGNINVFDQVKTESVITTLIDAAIRPNNPAEASKPTANSSTMVAEAKPAIAKPEIKKAETKPVVIAKQKAEPKNIEAKPAPAAMPKAEPKESSTKQVATAMPEAAKPKVAEEKKVVAPAPKVTQKATAPAKKTAYNIIVASVKAESDAQTAIDGFTTKGYPGAFLIKGNGRFRIALKAYDTEAEAYSKVNELKQNALFKDAWVLKTKR